MSRLSSLETFNCWLRGEAKRLTSLAWKRTTDFDLQPATSHSYSSSPSLLSHSEEVFRFEAAARLAGTYDLCFELMRVPKVYFNLGQEALARCLLRCTSPSTAAKPELRAGDLCSSLPAMALRRVTPPPVLCYVYDAYGFLSRSLSIGSRSDLSTTLFIIFPSFLQSREQLTNQPELVPFNPAPLFPSGVPWTPREAAGGEEGWGAGYCPLVARSMLLIIWMKYHG